MNKFLVPIQSIFGMDVPGLPFLKDFPVPEAVWGWMFKHGFVPKKISYANPAGTLDILSIVSWNCEVALDRLN